VHKKKLPVYKNQLLQTHKSVLIVSHIAILFYSLFITALHGMQMRWEVCPSVHLSVKHVHCDKTAERYV